MSNVIFAMRKGKVIMRLVKGINDVETLYPDLAKEWDYENNDGKTPDQFTKGSNELINWICTKCGLRWPARIKSRTRSRSCPCCTYRVVVPGKNDLASSETCWDRGRLRIEWDYESNEGQTPDQFTIKSRKTVNWRCCSCGYRWSARIIDRVNGQGCPADAGLRFLQERKPATIESDLTEKTDC